MFPHIRRNSLYIFLFFQILFFFLYYTTKNSICILNSDNNKPDYEWISSEKNVLSVERQKKYYDQNMPLIFIGGMPRSGTTLLRVLLDAHPEIRCGEETRVIPRILSNRQKWLKVPFESKRLEEAGITTEVLDSAIGKFILEVIVRHGKWAPRLCNKDPFTLRSARYLKTLFPNSKFIFMIRDGRAVVHSIITREVTISGFQLTNFRQCLKKWNWAMASMYEECSSLGPESCLPIFYEQLVLNPKKWMKEILNFLEVSWNETVLHHEKLIEKGDITLSKLERSTDQVIKPINIEALSKWVGHIPTDVVKDMSKIAPMLSKLGYDPNANPPNYGEPDEFVIEKMNELYKNKNVWQRKEEQMKSIRNKLKDEISKKNEKHETNLKSTSSI